jgi:hypothetical protein
MEHDEAVRHRLYNELGDLLSPESTSELMRLLPPVGWNEMATRQDLHALENSIRADLHREINLATFRLLGGMFAVAGITWGAVTFGG